MPTLTIPCDQRVWIGAKAVVKDSEGNVIDANPIVVVTGVSTANTTGDFGTIAAPVDPETRFAFDPGTLGATGDLDLTGTVNGEAHEGTLSLNFSAGAPAVTELAIELTPVTPPAV